ncbi:unnamed protein product [Rangifer tarandus platyrhynchus]|uniref:Uncharacterized protein n=1 Tax=Rangifer tarandus platyrhynchus TaxID=3082113 RepID=A0AC59ZC49_RANTA
MGRRKGQSDPGRLARDRQDSTLREGCCWPGALLLELLLLPPQALWLNLCCCPRGRSKKRGAKKRGTVFSASHSLGQLDLRKAYTACPHPE